MQRPTYNGDAPKSHFFIVIKRKLRLFYDSPILITYLADRGKYLSLYSFTYLLTRNGKPFVCCPAMEAFPTCVE